MSTGVVCLLGVFVALAVFGIAIVSALLPLFAHINAALPR
jgi:hypothetical protein